MLTIDRMHADMRLSGGMAEREHLARRLERLARDRLAEALEEAAGRFATEEGEFIVIRRLDLRLWLDGGRLADGQIARLWAATLAKVLFHQLATGGPDMVCRYRDRADFLAQYLADLAGGRADDAWQYQQFAQLHDLPEGRRAVAALGRDPRWIGPVLHRLAAGQRLEATIARWTGADIARLWQLWTDLPPRAPAHLSMRQIGRATGIARPPLEDGDGADARGRDALRWLVALTARPLSLPAAVAAPLAMQLAHAATLARTVPGLRALIEGDDWDNPAILALLARMPGKAATGWLLQVLNTPENARGLAQLLDIAAGASPGQGALVPHPPGRRIASPHAGLALLLPALRDLGLGERLGPAGRLILLSTAIPMPQRLLAQGDPALRLLSALPPEAVLADLVGGIDWPAAEGQDAPPERALHAVLARFAAGLRGMEGAGVPYLCRQFLDGGGVVTDSPKAVQVRLNPVPLGILLRIGGRLGDQGPIAWLEGRALVLEMGDG